MLWGLPLLFVYTPEVNSQILEELSSPILYWLNFASQWVVKLKQTVCGRSKTKEVHLFQALLGNLFPLIKCSGSSICLAGTLCALCLPGPSMYLPASWELGPIQAPSTAWCPCPLWVVPQQTCLADKALGSPPRSALSANMAISVVLKYLILGLGMKTCPLM